MATRSLLPSRTTRRQMNLAPQRSTRLTKAFIQVFQTSPRVFFQQFFPKMATL